MQQTTVVIALVQTTPPWRAPLLTQEGKKLPPSASGVSSFLIPPSSKTKPRTPPARRTSPPSPSPDPGYSLCRAKRVPSPRDSGETVCPSWSSAAVWPAPPSDHQSLETSARRIPTCRKCELRHCVSTWLQVASCKVANAILKVPNRKIYYIYIYYILYYNIIYNIYKLMQPDTTILIIHLQLCNLQLCNLHRHKWHHKVISVRSALPLAAGGS